MSKKEIIWRYLLDQAISHNKFQFQQNEIGNKFGYSLSTVFNALKALRQTGAIKVTGRYFLVENAQKLLNIWATNRRIDTDIIYKTRVNEPVKQIESQIPPHSIYGAYSAYLRKFGDAPADYDKVYIYLTDSQLEEFKSRFPEKNGEANLFAVRADEEFIKLSRNGIAPIVQTYVDIWNLSDWYAKDFLNELNNKLFE